MKKVTHLKLMIAWVVVACCTLKGESAELRLPGIFTNDMVLQRGLPIHLWGWSAAGSSVTAEFQGSSVGAQSDATGSWSLYLPAHQANGKGASLKISDGTSRIELHNVVVGDVWICGGQSNMGVGVERMKTVAPDVWAEIVATSDYPNLRYFAVREQLSPFEEKTDIAGSGSWTPLSKDTDLSRLRPSGIGFFFARKIHRATNVPIGFIRSNIGGSGAECWMSMTTLRSCADGELIVDVWKQTQSNYSEEKVQAWIDDTIKKAEVKGDTNTVKRYRNPAARPKEPVKSRHHPNNGFNGMIAPITGMTIKGIIWDQGEYNSGRAWQYRELLPLVISDWRKYWAKGNGDAAEKLPFYQVQIQDWGRPTLRNTAAPATQAFGAEIRDAQRYVADSVEHCEIAVTIDHHEGGDTHPLLKNIPGERLGAIALKHDYHHDIQWRGPTFREMKIEGNKIRLSFEGTGKGLMVGRRSGGNVAAVEVDEPLAFFAIAGDDNQYLWADAVIEGNEVIVSNKSISQPKNVRYAWEGNPEGCNLYNRDGWPATPFRTDALPYASEDRREPHSRDAFFMTH